MNAPSKLDPEISRQALARLDEIVSGRGGSARFAWGAAFALIVNVVVLSLSAVLAFGPASAPLSMFRLSSASIGPLAICSVSVAVMILLLMKRIMTADRNDRRRAILEVKRLQRLASPEE
jgi:hypothetical protein